MSHTGEAAIPNPPLCKRGKWSAEEDAALRRGVELFGDKQWKQVAQLIAGRQPIQCLHRWSDILKPGIVKGPWSAGEDAQLWQWVESHGPGKWIMCAQSIPGRTGKQCRERWNNAYSPFLKVGDWTEAEDSLIFEMFTNLGPKWTIIAKKLLGRTANSVKNRFYSVLQRQKGIHYEDFFLGE